ncbi:MAG: hypothetical protein AAF518_01815 [Spirochaetota bacterium]
MKNIVLYFMEHSFLDFINSGIALFRLGEASVSQAMSDLQTQLSKIQQNGESESSSQAKLLRELLDKAIRDTKGLLYNASAQYKFFLYQYISYLHSMNKQLEVILDLQMQTLNASTTKFTQFQES